MSFYGISPAFLGNLFPRLSVDFNGSNERMTGPSTQAAFGVANNWSYEIWLQRRSASTTAERMMDFGAANTQFALSKQNNAGGASATNGTLHLNIATGAGTNIKNGFKDNVLGLNTWHQVVVVFDFSSGTPSSRTMTVYVDGADSGWPGSWTVGADTTTQMAADTTRDVYWGSSRAPANFWQGRIYAAAWWDVILGSSEVSSLFAQPRRDRRKNFASYASKANLIHYWPPVLATDDNSLGNDYGTATSRNLMESAANITKADDLVGDGP